MRLGRDARRGGSCAGGAAATHRLLLFSLHSLRLFLVVLRDLRVAQADRLLRHKWIIQQGATRTALLATQALCLPLAEGDSLRLVMLWNMSRW